MRTVRTIKNQMTHEAFSIADYPACELFFPINETSGNTLTDLAAGVTCNYVTRVDAGGNPGSLSFASGAATLAGDATGEYGTVTAGTMPTLSNTKHPFMVVVADFGVGVQDTVNFGSAAGERLAVLAGVMHVLGDGTNTMSSVTGGVDANSEAIGMYLDRTAGEFHAIETDGAACTDIGNDSTYDAVDNIVLSNSSGSLLISGSAVIYGAALFNFATQVSANDMLGIVSWCNYQWRNNNKVLPPWLKNVA